MRDLVVYGGCRWRTGGCLTAVAPKSMSLPVAGVGGGCWLDGAAAER